jgi:hypothetical protein
MAGYEVSYGPGYGSRYEKCFNHNRAITDLNSNRPTFKPVMDPVIDLLMGP